MRQSMLTRLHGYSPSGDFVAQHQQGELASESVTRLPAWVMTDLP